MAIYFCTQYFEACSFFYQLFSFPKIILPYDKIYILAYIWYKFEWSIDWLIDSVSLVVRCNANEMVNWYKTSKIFCHLVFSTKHLVQMSQLCKFLPFLLTVFQLCHVFFTVQMLTHVNIANAGDFIKRVSRW